MLPFRRTKTKHTAKREMVLKMSLTECCLLDDNVYTVADPLSMRTESEYFLSGTCCIETLRMVLLVGRTHIVR